MEVIIPFLIIGIIIFLVIEKRQINKIVIPENPISIVIEKRPPGYKKRSSVMNGSESALFLELQKQLPPDYHIFPNMRLADIVDAINGDGFYKRRNKILPRHIDFVICDSYFKPILAIELNGSSHNRLDRMEMDEEKKKILEDAQIPLITVSVGDNFNESVLKIKESITL